MPLPYTPRPASTLCGSLFPDSPIKINEVEPVDRHEGDCDLENDEEQEVDEFGGETFPKRRKSELFPSRRLLLGLLRPVDPEVEEIWSIVVFDAFILLLGLT